MLLCVFSSDQSLEVFKAINVPNTTVVREFPDPLKFANNFSAIIVDCESLKKYPDQATLFLNHFKLAKTAVLSHQANDDNIKILVDFPAVFHILIADSDSLVHQVTYFLQDGTASQQAKNSAPLNIRWTAEKANMEDSSDRFLCYEQIIQYISTLNCFSGFSDIVHTATSELLSNAFYDAPRDMVADRAHVLDRSKVVRLQAPNSVTFLFGLQDDNFLWVGTVDSFGSLNRPKLIQSLKRASEERTAVLNKEGGAGLGLYMLFNWATSLYFVLEKNKKTEAYIKFKISRRRITFEKEKASIHIVEI